MTSSADPSAYLLDLDGTLYAAGAAIPGAPAALARLRARGTRFRLVTNTTSRSRAMLVERLRGYGFEATEAELFTATLAGVETARAGGHQVVAPFVAAPALADMSELRLVGGTSGQAARPGEVPSAVILGDLGESWSYALLQEAFEYLTGGAALIALSRDRYWLKDQRLALDAGPFVAALEYATGKAAAVAGKPSRTFYAAALRSLGDPGDAQAIDAKTVAMVGDDLWSDVLGAQAAGMQGWLVRTGKFLEDALRESGVAPDRTLDSIRDLP